MWSDLIDALPNHYKFITFDLPGHGENKTLNFEGMEGLADFVINQLRSSNIESAVFIGHSMGGYISCAIADKYPEMVDGIILFHSTSSEDDEIKKHNRDKAIKLVSENQRMYCSSMIRGLFAPSHEPAREELVNKLTQEACEMSVDAIIASLKSMKDRKDKKACLKNRNFFLAYVLGDEDPHLPMQKMTAEMDWIKPEKSVVIKNCGHMSQWEFPTASTEALLDCLKQFDLAST